MSKPLKYIFTFITLSLIAGAFLNFKNPTTTVSSPTSATIMPLIPSIDKNAKCHAQFINPTDPQAVLPDPSCTPGVTNPDVTQANIMGTICKSGYTSTIRPPASYTTKLKKGQIIEYGFTDTNTKDYEEDHFISLELGGSPDSPQNLWPEPPGAPNEKDRVENYLHKQICNGGMTLEEAQKEITTNWYTVYKSISK